MAKDKDRNDKETDLSSDSGELFESIFREAIATEDSKKEKKGRRDTPKGGAQEKVAPEKPPPVIEEPVQEETTKKGLFQKAKKADKPGKPEKPQERDKPKKPEKIRKTRGARRKKGAGSRNALLFLFLLVVLGAALFFYGDTLGLGGVKETLSGTVTSIKQKIMGPDESKVAMSQKRTGPVKKEGSPPAQQGPPGPRRSTAEKPPAPVRNPKIEPTQKLKTATPRTPGEKAAPLPKKEEAPVAAVKTDAPNAGPQKEMGEPSQRTAAKPSPKPEPAQTVKVATKGRESEKAAPVPKKDKAPAAAVKTTAPGPAPQKPVSQPLPAKKTTQVAALPEQHRTPKATAPAKTVRKRKNRSSYPYSVYLGSYKTISRAKRAVAIHQGQGLSPYWVKVDLGAKGVWYRIFEGHFASQGAAEAFIRAKELEEAKVKRTQYTNLIGVYSTIEDLRSRSSALLELGYCPYAIPEGDGEIALYAGAFYTKAGAETQHRELASQGIQNQVVTR